MALSRRGSSAAHANRSGWASRVHQHSSWNPTTPGTDHGVRVSLNPLKLTAAAEEASGPGSDFDDLLATTAAHLVALARGTGEVESQQTFVLQVLRALTRRLARELPLGEIAAVLRDPAATGLEDPDRFVRRADRERLSRQINNLEHGPAARLFTGGRPLDLD